LKSYNLIIIATALKLKENEIKIKNQEKEIQYLKSLIKEN